MLGIIGLVFLGIIGWVIFKMILSRVFPEWGLRDAEARYKRNPDHTNERLLWEARSRVNRIKK